MVKKMPDRWEVYSPIGLQIPGTRIISFKVPLKENVATHLPPQKRLTIPILLEKIPDLGLVIDLTMTTKYYNKNDLLDRGVSYAKIACPGQQLPNDGLVARFFSAIDTYLEKHSTDNTLIGVHCTHGVNRTGYLIARYLIEKLGFASQAAIELVGKMRGHPIERAPYTKSLFRCTPIHYGARSTPRSKDIEEPSSKNVSRPIAEFWPKKDTGSGKEIAKIERGKVFGKHDLEQGRVKSWDKHQPSTSRGPRIENVPGRFEHPEVFHPTRIKDEHVFEKQYHPREEVHIGDVPRVEKVKREYAENVSYPYNHVQEEIPKYQEPYPRNQYREGNKPFKERERFERPHDHPRVRSPIEEYGKPPPEEKHRDLVYHRAIREEIRIDYAPPIHREKEVYPREYEHRSYEFNHKDAHFEPHSRFSEKEIHPDRHMERERKDEIRHPRHFEADYGRDDFHSNFPKGDSFRERSPHRMPQERKKYEENYDAGHRDLDRRSKPDRYSKYPKPEMEERKHFPYEDVIRDKRIDDRGMRFPDEFRGRDGEKFAPGHVDLVDYDDHVRNRVPEERHFPAGSSFHGDSRGRVYEENERPPKRSYEHHERKRDFVEPVRERYDDFHPQDRSERNIQRRNFSPEKRFDFHNDHHMRDEFVEHRVFKADSRRLTPEYPPEEDIYRKLRRSPEMRSRSDRFEKDFIPNENFRRDDRRSNRREHRWNSEEKVFPPRMKSEERPLSPERFPRSRELETPAFSRNSRSRDRRSRERSLAGPKSANNGSRPDLREEIRLKRTHRELSLGHDRRSHSPMNREPRMSTEERDCRELINLKRGGNFGEPELKDWGKRDRSEHLKRGGNFPEPELKDWGKRGRPEAAPGDWEEPRKKRYRPRPAEIEDPHRWKHDPLENPPHRADWVPEGIHNAKGVRRDNSIPRPRSSSRGRGRGARSSGKPKVFDRLKRKPWE